MEQIVLENTLRVVNINDIEEAIYETIVVYRCKNSKNYCQLVYLKMENCWGFITLFDNAVRGGINMSFICDSYKGAIVAALKSGRTVYRFSNFREFCKAVTEGKI